MSLYLEKAKHVCLKKFFNKQTEVFFSVCSDINIYEKELGPFVLQDGYVHFLNIKIKFTLIKSSNRQNKNGFKYIIKKFLLSHLNFFFILYYILL